MQRQPRGEPGFSSGVKALLHLFDGFDIETTGERLDPRPFDGEPDLAQAMRAKQREIFLMSIPRVISRERRVDRPGLLPAEPVGSPAGAIDRDRRGTAAPEEVVRQHHLPRS